ncbi:MULTISPECIES: extracellular solute-binding protein [unclassified Paenibacillus]|uniref:extracellular solute-binding protein n=1 Tax=unclassified Paenibacillus TaxID=185978 RepID=UPI002F3E8CA3
MTQKMNKVTIIAIACLLMAAIAAGCSGGGKPAASPEASSSSVPSNAQQTDTPKAEVEYPKSVTYWVSLNGNAAATMKSFNEIAAYKELEKITGTKVEFQHPPTGQERDQFNLMIASGKLPDVIEFNWNTIAKGPDSLIKENRIIRLNELIEEHAPNLTKILNDNPDFKKLVTTDEGNIYVMPFLLGDPQLSSVNGPIIRKDWLDKLDLPLPVTIADWENVLTAFRDGDPNGNSQKDEIPYSFTITPSPETDENHAFIGAWGITGDFYHENGTVKYGPIQPEYKEYLTLMARWYKEGLLDKDYMTQDGKLKDAKVTGNQLGSFTAYAGSGIGRYTELMKEDPSFEIAGTTYPVLEAGGKALGQYTFPFSGIGAAISSSASNPEQIVKWLDYKYGEEGHMLFNFGIEGESYEMKDGYPTYTDKIMKNPDDLPITQAMAQYFIASWSGPILQDKRYIEQYYVLEQQREAQKNWMQADHSKLMPPVSLTAEESSKSASIMNDVKTYRDEMTTKFIMGAESLDNFDKYVATMKSMGIEEAIKARQAALDRFNNR